MALPSVQCVKLSNGASLAFVDSFAAVPAEERPAKYVTVVGLHGVGFNSLVWTPLLPFLPPSSGIRFVAYNQRSYAGSSPAYEPKDEGGIDVTREYTEDLLLFLEESLELPTETDEKGDVVLLGWSKGTLLPISLLSLVASSSPLLGSHVAFLTSHLRSIILFEPPGSALGRAPTQDYTSSMLGADPADAAGFAAKFAGWIGGYNEGSPPADQLPVSGIYAMDEALRSKAWEEGAVAHGFAWRLGKDGPATAAASRAALSGQVAGGHGRLGKLPIALFVGERTVGYCQDTRQVLTSWWAEKEGERRATRVVQLDGTNHFAFVHDPETFAKRLSEAVRELTV